MLTRPARAGRPAARRPRWSPGPTPGARRRRGGRAVGARPGAQVRLNLAQAERALARLRQSPAGAPPPRSPTARASPTTCRGVCIRAFVEARFDLGVAARAVAGQPDLEPQARARAWRASSISWPRMAGGAAGETKARRECRRRLPKLPAPYLPYLDAVAAAHARGEWRRGRRRRGRREDDEA